MPEVRWTEEQERVIRTRGKDILVSAAAGSGKTAVLVERIIQEILSEDHPVDVDHLLVVTFTKAAAREMKERIRLALDRAISEQPENHRLLRQRTLLSHARISTIDSFCSYIVQNHFDDIGLNPDFRHLDQTEAALLEKEALDQVMEKHYENNDAGFLELVACYGRRNKDDEVRKMIEGIYAKSLSSPHPKEWISHAADAYAADSPEKIMASPWMKQYMKSLYIRILDMKQSAEELREDTAKEECYQKLRKTAEEDCDLFSGILSSSVPATPEEVKRFFSAIESAHFTHFGPLTKKDKAMDGYDPEVHASMKNRRDAYKKAFASLEEKNASKKEDSEPSEQSMFFEDLLCDFRRIRPMAEKLTSLTLEFYETVQNKKEEKNALDFSDISQKALEILTNPDGTPTETARMLQSAYQEVMVDEYQDSNEVQEAILKSVSGGEEGHHDYFMVGDVKQSIYRFRLARPEIFLEKYKSFPQDGEGSSVRIDLTKNFRSREEVLDFTNDIFSRLMREEVGGVAYDDAAFLRLGNTSYPDPGTKEFVPEILVGEKTNFPDREHGIQDKTEFETKIIVQKIEELLSNGRVTDRETGSLRPVHPGDIAILCRKNGVLFDCLLRELGDKKIPAHLSSKSQYLDTTEVETILSYLTILDNPLQDIPMTAVLHSPLVGLKEEDLSKIRMEFPEVSFAEAVLSYRDAHQNDEDDRVVSFFRQYETDRMDAKRIPLHELIERVLDRSGYLVSSSALPGGENRRRNLEKLIDLSISFEKNVGSGIFSFINYIRRIRRYQIPGGEDSLTGDVTDSISLMTIHGSKGLEFPIVILAETGALINTEDEKKDLLIHPDYGCSLIGIETGENGFRKKKENRNRQAMKDFMKADDYGEEIRVLYVALTRAREKLIITGISSVPREKIPVHASSDSLTVTEILGQGSYLKWILLCLSFYEEKYAVRWISTEDFPEESPEEAKSVSDSVQKEKERLLSLADKADPAVLRELSLRENYQYPLSREDGLKVKYTVSELKHEAMDAVKDRESEEAIPETADFLKEEIPDVERKDPAEPPTEDEDVDGVTEDCWTESMEESSFSDGALRGTAIHRFLELHDFQMEHPSDEKLSEELQRFLSEGRISPEEAKLIPMETVLRFTETTLYGRMKEADKKGDLHRETPFVLGVSPDYLENPAGLFDHPGKEEGKKDSETVLIQGTIDAYFLEDGNPVLVDYKSDHVRRGEELVRRYQRQVEWYRLALERATGKRLKEGDLYSLALGETVRVF